MPSRWWREIDVATESLTPRIQRRAEGRRFFQGVSLLNLFICRRVSAALYIILPLGGLFYQHTETTTDDAGRALNYSSAVHFRCDEFLSNRNYSNQNKHANHSEMVGQLKLTPCASSCRCRGLAGTARHSEAAPTSARSRRSRRDVFDGSRRTNLLPIHEAV